MNEIDYTGVIADPRSKKEKKKDWTTEEVLASSSPIEWKAKRKWKSYTSRNQHRTGSCVPQSVSKALEINELRESGDKVVFSASKAYAERTNHGSGSWPQQMAKYAVDGLYTTEASIKSQMCNSDQEMSDWANNWDSEDRHIGEMYGSGAYLDVKDLDFDKVASYLDQGHPVIMTFYFTSKEWSKRTPTADDLNLDFQSSLHHEVCATDFGIKNGKKVIRIEDSAHFGKKTYRYITEDFFYERCYSAQVIYDKRNIEETTIDPIYQFTKTLHYGMRVNYDVKQLQKKLKADGFFPESIPCTGNYLEITRQSVDKYQRHHEVASVWELNAVRGRIVGPKTRLSLNQ